MKFQVILHVLNVALLFVVVAVLLKDKGSINDSATGFVSEGAESSGRTLTGLGKGKGSECYDKDGELQLKWVGTYGNMYNKGYVQAINEPYPLPIAQYTGTLFDIIRGPEDTNSYEWTLRGDKTIAQQFDGKLMGQEVGDPASFVLKPISIGADCEVLRISGIYQENGFACAEQTTQCSTSSWIFTADRV
ncbi:hypothetical protein TrRE_jg2121 [Triparma retinervis]|uniref:Uncharacterized protein n=1 Tax=Triparma retinervis TaxID=2557542 RepID=A0A9W7A448_9STRA|nr:hypothetical protein TrRE_jg2121 [Triparma retinervis]